MTHLKCGTHGRQKETFVCKHITQTLQDGVARGFVWDYVDGAHEAICGACNELSEAAFQAQAEENGRSLCYGCFRDAAAINGAVLD